MKILFRIAFMLFLINSVFVIFLLVSSVSHAAELRGRLTGISDAKIEVTCGEIRTDQIVGDDGSYAIFGLPTKKACSFIVSSGEAHSDPIPFSTTRSVTIFNGRLKLQNKIILVVRH